jgi:uncharacterized RDD family membrane protein YckC
MPNVPSRSLARFLVVALAALAIAWCAVAPSAVAQTAAATVPASTTQPLFVAVTSSDVWVVQRTREMLDTRDITIVRRMSTVPQSDARYREIDTLRGDVVDVAASGDRLVILFADGSWGWIGPDSTFTAALAVDRTLKPVAIAGDRESVWFLCRATPSTSTAPATAPATQPVAEWSLLRRNWNGAVTTRLPLPVTGPHPFPSVAVATDGSVVFAIGRASFFWRDGDFEGLTAPLRDDVPDRLVPLDGWPVPAVVKVKGARIELIEAQRPDPVRLQVDESIASGRWAVAAANGELRFVGRQGVELVDQIIKRDGTAVRPPAPLQIVPTTRAPPGVEAMQLAMMLTLGAVVLIVWLRASRPGSAGVPTSPDVVPRDASGKPLPVVTPAPLTTRCLAASIDYMPVWLVMGIGIARQTDPVSLNAILLAALVGYIVYCTVCEVVFGRTIGKRLLRLRVATVAGGKPTLMAVALRNALRIIEAHPAFMAFALFSMMVTPMRQRLGDFVAGTTVVPDDARPAGSSGDSVQNPTGRADDKESN